jgi:hypothetical protein
MSSSRLTMQDAVLLVLALWSSEKASRLGGRYRFHLQDRRESERSNQQKLSLSPASADSLLDLLFNHKDGGDIFLRSVKLLLTSRRCSTEYHFTRPCKSLCDTTMTTCVQTAPSKAVPAGCWLCLLMMVSSCRNISRRNFYLHVLTAVL